MGAAKANRMPIVGKIFCSCSEEVFLVRRRPHVVCGGGFVVTDCGQKVGRWVWSSRSRHKRGAHSKGQRRRGFASHSSKGRDAVQALSIHKKWKGYTVDYEGLQKSVFSLKEPKSCFAKNNAIRISTEPRTRKKDLDFEIKGYFPDKACSILDHTGNTVAQVGVKKEVEEVMTSKDLYQVVVKPGIDRAFVFGIIAVLDNLYHESTKC